MKKIIEHIKGEKVLLIAFAAAAVSMLIVPPDVGYAGYVDWDVLMLLFALMAVVAGLKACGLMDRLSDALVSRAGNARALCTALSLACFFSAMLVTNDVALITFVPLTVALMAAKPDQLMMTVTLETIAANLGSMATPIGNPQNLYLYTRFAIPTFEFMKIMVLPFAVAIALITACCLIFVKPEPLEIKNEHVQLPVKRTILYMVLFLLSIAIVFRGIPYWIGLLVIPLVLFFADPDALYAVDYPLLLTFVFFFVFSGNMARIAPVRMLFSALMERSTLLFSVLSCQVISNVPSAILLSQFTGNYADLLVGVNIGGVGTLISSLASLITFSQYTSHNPDKTGYYVKLFSAFNFSFLFLLTGIMLLTRMI